MKYIIDEEVVSSRPVEGPLSDHLACFAKWVRDAGYAVYSRRRHVLLAACFSRWLGQQGVRVDCITDRHVVRYLRSRADQVKICRGDAAALTRLVVYMRAQGVIPEEKGPAHRSSPAEQVAIEFERYLLNERALALTTALHYSAFVRRFLLGRFGRKPVKLSQLSAGDVVRFVQRQVRRLHVKHAN